MFIYLYFIVLRDIPTCHGSIVQRSSSTWKVNHWSAQTLPQLTHYKPFQESFLQLTHTFRSRWRTFRWPCLVECLKRCIIVCFSATAAAVLVCIRVSKHLLQRQSRYPPNGRNMQRNNRPDRLMQKTRWIKKRTAHSYLAFLISFHDSCERRLTLVARSTTGSCTFFHTNSHIHPS